MIMLKLQILKNFRINNKVYNKKEIKTLRYGKVIFMTDQDLDALILKDCVLICFIHNGMTW